MGCLAGFLVRQPSNLSIYQSINQSIYQSINQSIYLSINQSINQSIYQSIGGFISLQGNNFAVPREAAKNIFFRGH